MPQTSVPLIKSPSDSTIYTPAWRKLNNNNVSLIEKISNFVESIRLDAKVSDQNNLTTRNDKEATPLHLPGRDNRCVERSSPQAHCSTNNGERSDGGRYADRPDESGNNPVNKVTDQLLLQAEKFKTRVEAPKGNDNYYNLLMSYDYEKLRTHFVTQDGLAPIDHEIMLLRNFDQDDEFFHITSQIEPGLKLKIERGEFVELERLLPKDKFGGRNANEEIKKQLFQLITQRTNTYLEPPHGRTNRISNICKWDQAFRVYAAIYTRAYPERSSEILQYIYVIHTAAATNPRDNVYFYDINFRELMARKPWRSWGKTYTQGWNMAFNNGSTGWHNNTGGHHQGQIASSNTQGSYGAKNASNSKSWKDDCCWRFNKNKCSKTGQECRYDHRCTYCAGWNHGFHNCRKRNNKQQKKSSNGNGNGSPVKNEK